MLAAAGGGVTYSLADAAFGDWLRQGSGGYSTLTGHAINDESVMRITTAFACIRTIAETAGVVTGAVYEKQKNGNAEKVDHDIGELLFEKPNPDMNGLEYREAKITNLAARGNAYSILSAWSNGQARTLEPVPASRVTPKRKQDGSIWYTVTDGGRTVDYPAAKVWHWKGFGYDGLLGLSPIGCAAQAHGLSLAGEDANARLFANGLSSSAVVKIPQWLKADQRKLAEDKLAQMHSGLMNYGKPYLLEGGMDLAEGIFTPQEAQFLELRKFQIAEICRLYRISPHMVADLERATNNNIEQLSLEFVMYTMLPYFRRIEEKAQQLFKPADRGRFFVRFNVESLLRADSVARGQLYSILLQNGVFNRNEVRALENRNRSDAQGMDDYTVQSNMVPIDKLAELVKKASAPPAAPPPPPPAASTAVHVHNNMPPSEVKAEFKQGDTHVHNAAPEVHVQNNVEAPAPSPAPVVHAPVNVRAYPSESTETLERGADKEIRSITRKNKD